MALDVSFVVNNITTTLKRTRGMRESDLYIEVVSNHHRILEATPDSGGRPSLSSVTADLIKIVDQLIAGGLITAVTYQGTNEGEPFFSGRFLIWRDGLEIIEVDGWDGEVDVTE